METIFWELYMALTAIRLKIKFNDIHTTLAHKRFVQNMLPQHGCRNLLSAGRVHTHPCFTIQDPNFPVAVNRAPRLLPCFGGVTAALVILIVSLSTFLPQSASARQISDAIKQLNVSFGSPEAAQFSRYGNLDVSLFKGVPSVTVPLHEFSLKDFSLPVYLSYNAGGIKVDEIASNVGLGWSLFAGGQINQFVQDKNDLLEGGTEGVVNNLSDFMSFDPNIWNGVSQAGYEDYHFAWSMFDPDPLHPQVSRNLKPDIFYYSYGNTSGRFIFDGELNTFHSIPYQNHIIFYNNQSLEFTITDEHGNQYIFDQRESTITQKDIHKCKGGIFPTPNTPLSTALKMNDIAISNDWKLGKIITNNQDTLLFEYTSLDPYFYYDNLVQQRFQIDPPESGCPVTTSTSRFDCVNSKMIAPLVLQRIKRMRNGNAIERVEFIYQSQREDFGNSSFKTLDEVQVYRHDQLMTFYTLHQSYFSTGSTQRHKRLKLESVQQDGMPAYHFHYDESSSLPPRGPHITTNENFPNSLSESNNFAQDHWGFFNGIGNNQSLIPHYAGLSGTGNRSMVASKVGTWSMKQITYPTGGATILNMQGYEGGLRAHSIMDLNAMGDTTGSRYFTYDLYVGGWGHNHMDYIYFFLENDHNDYPSCRYQAHTASSVLPVTILDGLDTGFGKVTIEYNQNGIDGKTEVLFSRNINELSSEIFTFTQSAIRWGIGEKIQETHFNAAGQPISRTRNTYTVHYNDSNIYSQLPAKPLKPKENHKYAMDIRVWRAQEVIGAGGLFNFLSTKPARFDIYRMRVASVWYHPDSTYNYAYDPGDPSKFIKTVTTHEFDTTSTRLRALTEVNSDLTKRRTNFAYGVPGKPSQLRSVEIRDAAETILQKRWAQWSNTLGSGRQELHEIWDWTGGDTSQPGTNNAIKIAGYNEYDSWGNPLQQIDANGSLTRYFFGTTANPLSNSQTGVNATPGVYLTGIEQVNTSGPNLSVKAFYDSRGRIVQMIDTNDQNRFYVYDSFGRLIRIQGGSHIYKFPIQEYDYEIFFDGNSSYTYGNHNRIVSRSFTGGDIWTQVQYFDGLGRPIQSQVALDGSQAIVQHTFYDAAGRLQAETKPIIASTGLQYKSVSSMVGSNWSPGMPLPTTGSDLYTYHKNTLGHTTNDSRYAYSQFQYKNDPLGRVDKQAAPGYDFRMNAGTQRTLRFEYSLNSVSAEAFTTLGYGVNKLHKQTLIDENNTRSWTFTDGWGRAIAQVVDLSGNNAVNSTDIFTGFEYDLMDRLVKVHEPKGWGTSNYKREYTYDKRGLLISENNPDIEDTTDYKYDKAGNLRLVRNAEHKKTGSYSEINDYTTFIDQQNPRIIPFEVPKNSFIEIIITTSGFQYEDELLVEVEKDSSGSGRKIYSHILWGSMNKKMIAAEGQYKLVIKDFGYGPDPSSQYVIEYSIKVRPIHFTYYKYDSLGRVIDIGEYYGDPGHFTQTNADATSWPTTSYQATLLNHYDENGWSGATNLKGRLVRSQYLDLSSWNWGNTWYSYDHAGNVNWVRQDPPSLAAKLIQYTYNRQGQVTKVSYQPNTSTDRLITWFEYDGAGRLERLYTNRTDNKNTAKLEAAFTYIADSQIDKKTLGGDQTTGGAQIVDYAYHMRGWLKSINNPDNLSSPAGFPDTRFAMEMRYEDQSVNSTNWSAQFNGNISQIRWKLTPPNPLTNDGPLYNFKYDKASRLTRADFHNTNSAYQTGNAYDVDSLAYDKSGNFTTLRRYHDPGQGNAYYQYRYHDNTNQLKNVVGSSTLEHYTYDDIGNLKTNANRGISSIGYDSRNLPYRLIQSNSLHEYGYDAQGQRIFKMFTSFNFSNLTHTYVRGADGQVLAVYSSGTILYWNIPGGLGRVVK